jgi:hypothetical protein
VLAGVIEKFSEDELHGLRPIILTVWRELLKSEKDSASFSSDSVTINRDTLPVFDGIKSLRNRAIGGLFLLFDGSSTAKEKREVVSALQEAMRLSGRSNDPNELLQLTLEDTQKITELLRLILEDTQKITDSLTQRASGQPYDLLEHIEHEMLFDYRRAQKFAINENDKFGCKKIAKDVMEAIITFRDLINADPYYICYKVLVGYESVFPFHWENEAYTYVADNEYRKAQAAGYIDEISDETADDWNRLIQRCAATQSNDMATFPVFREFLQQLARAKPHIAVAFARRDDPNVLAFLPPILDGLYESEARDIYAELIEDYLDRNAYLPAIARHCRLVKKDAADIVKKALNGAIAADEGMAVSECLIFAIENHDPQALPLVDNVFVPAITYLISKREAQWISRTYFLLECKKFFHELPSEYADLVLENLLALKRINHESESILAPSP